MKRRNGIFTALAALLIVAVVAILATWASSWKSQNISNIPASSITKRVGSEKAISPTNGIPILIQTNEAKESIEDFGSPDTWPFFNQNYQSPYRRFRFKYPTKFEIQDRDSDVVWLKKDGEYYLGVNEDVHLTGYSQSETPDEQFRSYYLYKKMVIKDLPDLDRFERINFSGNNFVYKIPEDEQTGYFGQPSTALKKWNRYLGVINRQGIDIIDLKKLPEDIIFEIIQSIEFK